MSNSASIIVDHVSKYYGDVTALDDICLEVNEGELFGLIGPDGSGKSSLFRILTTLILCEKGSATVAGFDVVKDYKKIRESVGYMPGRFSLYQDLSVEENLEFFASIFGTTIHENYDLVRDIYVQLEPFKKRKAGQLSGGMKQKLALCCSLIHKPAVLFLDEPTTGVDPVSRKEFWEMLNRLKEKGISILVSTPYMDEASLCDRVALMQNGRILTMDTPSNIENAYNRQMLAVRTNDMYALINDLRAYDKGKTTYAFGEYLHFTEQSEEINQDEVRQYLYDRGHQQLEMKLVKPGIEDCFMDLMN